MSQYKDFSDYNSEAENIRPTARIQLIQRILNAANIISSLASGVPLKWASAYKSFQVLKYQENQDPTDVTTENAVSAVDSILHEAESQLRASQDDMNTLKMELVSMPISGVTDWSAGSKLNPSTYYRLMTFGGVDNTRYSACLYTDGEGSFDSILYVMLNATFNSLPSRADIISNNTIPLIVETANTSDDARNNYFKIARMSSADDNKVFDVGAYKRLDSISRNFTIEFYKCTYTYSSSRKTFVSSYPQKIVISDIGTHSFPTGSDIQQIPFTTNSAIVAFNGKYSAAQIPIMGNADADTSLGLPDPTDLIGILDNMTN